MSEVRNNAGVLVTGANGFVGSALIDRLQRAGKSNVRGAVRSATVALPAGVERTVIGDIGPQTDWSDALRGIGVVVHLAARVHVMREAAGDPLAEFRRINVDATLRLAQQAVQAGVRRFVFVSSIKVNGELTDGTPFTAHDVPHPGDPYGVSKYEAEISLHELARRTGLELVIVRPPLVYGPGVRANFLKLMQLVKRGLPLPLGGIRNRRSMVALDNLTDLLALCTSHPTAAGETFLVSDDSDLGISELIGLIADAMDKRILLLPVPAGLMLWLARAAGKADVANRLLGSLEVDIAHTKNTLGWHPPQTPAAAVRQTVAHFLKRS